MIRPDWLHVSRLKFLLVNRRPPIWPGRFIVAALAVTALALFPQVKTIPFGVPPLIFRFIEAFVSVALSGLTIIAASDLFAKDGQGLWSGFIIDAASTDAVCYHGRSERFCTLIFRFLKVPSSKTKQGEPSFWPTLSQRLVIALFYLLIPTGTSLFTCWYPGVWKKFTTDTDWLLSELFFAPLMAWFYVSYASTIPTQFIRIREDSVKSFL